MLSSESKKLCHTFDFRSNVLACYHLLITVIRWGWWELWLRLAIITPTKKNIFLLLFCAIKTLSAHQIPIKEVELSFSAGIFLRQTSFLSVCWLRFFSLWTRWCRTGLTTVHIRVTRGRERAQRYQAVQYWHCQHRGLTTQRLY